MRGTHRVFWWGAGFAIAAGWWLACGSVVFLLLLIGPERAWRPGELVAWGATIVIMTLAAIISVLSLFPLSLKQPGEWVSSRTRAWAFTIAGLIQLFVFVAVWAGPPLGAD